MEKALRHILAFVMIIFVFQPESRGQVVDTICPGNPYGTYGVQGFANSVFQWQVSGGQLISANGTDSVVVEWDLNAAQHFLEVVEISSQGCIGDTVFGEVVIAQPPNAEIIGADSVCKGEIVVLNASPQAKSYLWNSGQTTSTVQFTVDNDTTVSLIVDDGCTSDTTSKQITSLPKPVADFTVTPPVVKAGKEALFSFSGSGGQFFDWVINSDTLSAHQSDVYHQFRYAGTYEVILMVSNEYLCQDTAMQDILVRELSVNTITPNGDGINDTWQLSELDGNDQCQVWIYDKWSGKVFYSEGYDEPWDGTHNGNPVPEGSYYYVIDYGDGSEPEKGIINVIK